MLSCAHSLFPAVAASWLCHLSTFLPFVVLISSVLLVWHYVLHPTATASRSARSARSSSSAPFEAGDDLTAYFGEVDIDDVFGEAVDIDDILWESDVDDIFGDEEEEDFGDPFFELKEVGADERALLSYVPSEDIFDELVKDESEQCEQELKQLRKDYDWDEGWFRRPVSLAKYKQMMSN